MIGAATLLMAGCSPQLPKGEFLLEGTVQGIDNEYIYLSYMQNDTAMINDSVLVENGAFKLQGKLDNPFAWASLYQGNPMDPRNRMQCRIFLEPQAMTVAIDTADFMHPTITGSLTQAQADTLFTALENIEKEAEPLYKALEAETDHDKSAEISEKLEPYIERMKKQEKAFIKSHSDSYISPLFLSALMSDMPYEELDEIYNSFSDKVKQIKEAKEVEKELTTRARIQPGAQAPDFKALSIGGDSIQFSETVKGKYVLLDFWASWCVPCRKSFPHVKELYKKYHDKGLEVFCVADNDSQPDEWHKAVEKDGVEMFHHVLRGLKIVSRNPFIMDKTHDVSELYAIHYLPTKYLIDNEGKIIGKFEDEELDAKLQEIFGE